MRERILGKRSKTKKIFFEEIISENFPYLMKTIKL